jgi:hypothetical protein
MDLFTRGLFCKNTMPQWKQHRTREAGEKKQTSHDGYLVAQGF